MKLKPVYLMQGFTAFSAVQALGYLGTAYTALAYPTLIIFLVLVIIALLLGLSEWAAVQSQQNTPLNRAKIVSSLTGSIILIVFLFTALLVGVWIAS